MTLKAALRVAERLFEPIVTDFEPIVAGPPTLTVAVAWLRLTIVMFDTVMRGSEKVIVTGAVSGRKRVLKATVWA